MDLIRGQCFHMLLQNAEESEFDMGEINPAQESYWEDVGLDYGVEEYHIEDVHDLEKKIKDIKDLNDECSKYMAVIAFREFWDNLNVKSDTEMYMAELPEYVYRM